MRNLLLATGACLAVGLGAGQAQAGIYTDDLTRCLVKASSPSDRQDFMIFIFAAMSAHPDVQQYAKMSAAQQEASADRASKLMERLLTVDCRKETVAALKYERQESISRAFSTLGETAMADLTSHPAVEKVFERLGKDLDEGKWDALAKEAN